MRFAALDKHIRANHSQIHSFLVVERGVLVYERYFNGRKAGDAAEIRSVTKSISSALVGIALKQGYLESLEQQVLPLLGRQGQIPTGPHIESLTVRHLLSMTSGLEWYEPGDYLEWQTTDDWAVAALRLPVVEQAGRSFNYNSATFHLLSPLLTCVIGEDLEQFALRHLFGPLGINPQGWSRDPQGFPAAASDLRLTPRDMAKFGYLYLNNGRWEENELIPPDYVLETTTEHSPGGFPEEGGYGCGWWTTTTRGHHAFFAAGYGGQYIYVVPDLALVAVITANPFLAPQDTDDYLYLIEDHLLPAIS